MILPTHLFSLLFLYALCPSHSSSYKPWLSSCLMFPPHRMPFWPVSACSNPTHAWKIRSIPSSSSSESLPQCLLPHLLFKAYSSSEIAYLWSLSLRGNDFLLSVILINISSILPINHKFLECIICDRCISVGPQDAITCLSHSRCSLNEWANRP